MTSKNKKILIFIKALVIGGAERQVVQDANLLAEHGYEVTVCCGRSGPLKDQLGKKVKLHNLNTDAQIPAAFKLYKHFAINKYDLVFSHMFWANKVAAIATTFSGHKLIIFEHGLGLWRKWYHLVLVRLAAKRAAAIVTCSNAGKVLKIQRERLPADAVRVIFNSFQPVDVKDGANDVDFSIHENSVFKFAFCGRFNAVKQLPLLVEIASIIKKEVGDEFCFLLIGDGEQRGGVESLIEDNLLQENFNLTGYVENPFMYLKQSNCFVLPSSREDFSLALLEASYCELPCVAFNVGGNSEIIDDGKTGYIVPPYDIQKMASKLIFLMNNPEKSTMMGKKAKNKVLDAYNSNNRLYSLNKLIRELT